MNQRFEQVLVQPGKYYLGDPCYSVPDEFWMDLLESADYFESKNEGTVSGFTVYAFSTAYGDGSYQGTNGFNYPVDAGMIGLVPVEFASELQDIYEGDTNLCTVIEFETPTVCTYKNGLMSFGNISIDTDPAPEDEDDYEDDYYYDPDEET